MFEKSGTLGMGSMNETDYYEANLQSVDMGGETPAGFEALRHDAFDGAVPRLLNQNSNYREDEANERSHLVENSYSNMATHTN
jgi:hypothetical protein